MVLAGGRGTRLVNLTDHRAKPAVPFGGQHRIIDFALSNCLNSGVRQIGVATQFKAHSLIRHVRDGWTMFDPRRGEALDLLPAQQRTGEGWYGGTADAVFQNLDVIRAARPEYVLILAGDHVYRMDYAQMLSDHVAKGADLSIACIDVPVADARGFGVMGVDTGDRIVRFTEKPDCPDPIPGSPGRALASMGIYIFNASFLFYELERDARTQKSSHDFGKDIIPFLVDRARVYAHRFASSAVGAPYWRDVGTVASYWAANMELLGGDPAFDPFDRFWPIAGGSQLPHPARFVTDGSGNRSIAVDSLVAGGCVVEGSRIERSVLSPNVSIGGGTTIAESVLLPGVQVGRNVRLRRVIVDSGCVIPDYMAIGENAATDGASFHVDADGIVLVNAEMLARIDCRQERHAAA